MAAIMEGNVDHPGLTDSERALMRYAKLITETAPRSTHEDVQQLRDVGWSEDQIAEAVYIIALFAFFNRVADAFGVQPQDYLTMNRMTP
ncbi:MAG: carboxymuconolactone decarboxylase family protein [Terriglobales bacterium]